MEAPVPASALIHSATLVSAGVFLIMRFYPILELSFYFKFVTAVVGALTAFVGGVSAVFQTDLKKILAYSTISHCGFLIFLCSFGNFKLVIVYLFVHGFFKAISFLCVGNIIRFSRSYQDLRRMGSLFKYLPAEFFFLIFSLLNLSGLPFFFGFYSKTLLFMISDVLYFRDLIFCTILLSCITGLFYSFNIIYYSFFDSKKARKSIYTDAANEALRSFYYSNTTLASNIAIFLLILSSCFICAYLINFFLLSLSNASDFYLIFVKSFSFSFGALSSASLLNYSFFY
jgi:NADH:ubiquinone oxidoreductase subunit 5 (subunit L)/multisubunit Na+/H+ antiporter MnhA subunit